MILIKFKYQAVLFTTLYGRKYCWVNEQRRFHCDSAVGAGVLLVGLTNVTCHTHAGEQYSHQKYLAWLRQANFLLIFILVSMNQETGIEDIYEGRSKIGTSEKRYLLKILFKLLYVTGKGR